jgi:hypothetical protein
MLLKRPTSRRQATRRSDWPTSSDLLVHGNGWVRREGHRENLFTAERVPNPKIAPMHPPHERLARRRAKSAGVSWRGQSLVGHEGGERATYGAAALGTCNDT